ncbi:MAG: ComEC/Rec2 family competence protein, partial [Actinomycetes bacterium]
LADGVPAAGVLANLLAVPAAGVVMVLGLTAVPLSVLLDPRLAVPLMWPARVLVRWVWLVAGAAARAPLPLLGPARLAVVAVAVVLAAVARSRWADSAALRRAAFGSLGLLVLAAVTVSGARAPGVHDLGSGVRMIVGDCGGRAVDVSGASTAPDRVLDRLHQQGVHRIDVLVVAGNRRGVALARDIASTASVQRIVAPIDVAVGPVVPLTNGPLDVGGLTLTAVGAGRPSGRVQVQRVPCTVAP